MLMLGVSLILNSALATSSSYTKAGKPYMGWHSTYVQQFAGLGDSISEQFLKCQTDWVAHNFKSYGYEWICLDGWIGSGNRHNADGYVTTFSDRWAGGWTEMANYVHSKGLKFGMYYNPVWVKKSIADDTTLKINNTDLSIKSICRNDKMFEDWYMIDTNLPGAEQSVKGFISYFIDCGVDMLKIDFLSYYEVDYEDHERTMKLLKWCREAAADNLILTLSMPLSFNHMQDERNYGDNIRVVKDYEKNGWKHTCSQNRGLLRDTTNSRENWPIADNVYDGLSWSSDIAGIDKFIASPDYYTFHDGATPDEKKFALSIRVISGAAVEFGDSFNDIGGDENANYLRNSELMTLNAEGFCGKPLTRTPNDPKNQIWKGITTNGDYVVALFNRDDKVQSRSLNFSTDLGLNESYQVRDLWAHANIGLLSSFSVNVPSHGVVVIRIFVNNPLPGNGEINPPKPLITNKYDNQ